MNEDLVRDLNKFFDDRGIKHFFCVAFSHGEKLSLGQLLGGEEKRLFEIVVDVKWACVKGGDFE